MMRSVKLLLLAVPMLIVLDALWFGVVAREVYRHYLAPFSQLSGGFLAVNLPAAFLVYLLLGVGLLAFVLPRVAPGDRTAGFVWGALFGFVVYGIYDLTNYALLSTWSARLVVIDMLWGAFVMGAVSWFLTGRRGWLGASS